MRLIGIDTPETTSSRTRRVECFGPEAIGVHQAAAARRAPPLRLERDVVGRDDYGRLLAYVYRAADGLFVNDAIVASGYATPADDPAEHRRTPTTSSPRATRRRGGRSRPVGVRAADSVPRPMSSATRRPHARANASATPPTPGW